MKFVTFIIIFIIAFNIAFNQKLKKRKVKKDKESKDKNYDYDHIIDKKDWVIKEIYYLSLKESSDYIHGKLVLRLNDNTIGLQSENNDFNISLNSNVNKDSQEKIQNNINTYLHIDLLTTGDHNKLFFIKLKIDDKIQNGKNKEYLINQQSILNNHQLKVEDIVNFSKAYIKNHKYKYNIGKKNVFMKLKNFNETYKDMNENERKEKVKISAKAVKNDIANCYSFADNLYDYINNEGKGDDKSQASGYENYMTNSNFMNYYIGEFDKKSINKYNDI